MQSAFSHYRYDVLYSSLSDIKVCGLFLIKQTLEDTFLTFLDIYRIMGATLNAAFFFNCKPHQILMHLLLCLRDYPFSIFFNIYAILYYIYSNLLLFFIC